MALIEQLRVARGPEYSTLVSENKEIVKTSSESSLQRGQGSTASRRKYLCSLIGDWRVLLQSQAQSLHRDDR